MTYKKKTSILLVEDDPNLSIVLKDFLEISGYTITHCADGEAGLNAYVKNKFDLAILDVMLPKKDGFTLATDIRKTDEQLPIIFLTAKNLKNDKLEGFKAGCDDYITKPFITEELNLRIKAILKRCQLMDRHNPMNEGEGVISIGKYAFDYKNLTLSTQETTQNLTRKEADLLKVLCLNMNNILTREKALKSVWGDDDYFAGRSMDVFITKLRKYLRQDTSISITNIHGTGFKLEVSS